MELAEDVLKDVFPQGELAEVSIRRIHRDELMRSAAFTVSTASGVSVVTAVNQVALRRADTLVSLLRDAVFPPAIHH